MKATVKKYKPVKKYRKPNYNGDQYYYDLIDGMILGMIHARTQRCVKLFYPNQEWY